MRGYVVKRSAIALLTIFITISFNFVLFRVLPGTAVTRISRIPHASPALKAALEHEFGSTPSLFSCAVVKKGELYVRHADGEYSLTVAQLAEELKAIPNAKMIGPALTDYRAPLEALGVAGSTFAEGPLVPSAVALAALARLPVAYDAQAVFALEPHYLRGSGAEENPKFPPLPGVEPKARLKED